VILLVVGGANIVVLPDIAYIPNDHGLDAPRVERRIRFRRLLMFDFLDLVLDLPELLALGLDQLFSAAVSLSSSQRVFYANISVRLCS
jgi:hypothetical protein